MLDTEYAFMSGYLKGEESKLVTSEHIDRMLQASSTQDALGIIEGTDIGSYLEEVPIGTFDDLDEHLWGYFRQCTERLEWFKLFPGGMRRILRGYIAKYDVLNAKAALWPVATGRKVRMLPLGTIQSYGLLDSLADAENLNDIIETLTRCKLESYANILRENEKLMDEGAKSRLKVEARLDSEYYRNMLNIARATKDGPLFAKALGFIIDLTNLQIISRAIIEGMGAEAAEYTIDGGHMIPGEMIRELLSLRLSDIPGKLENTPYRDVAQEISSSYEATKSIAVVAEVIDKHRFRLVREILSPRVLSPLMIAWYLMLKEIEIRNVRLILKAIIDGISPGEVKSYLVVSS